MLFSFGMYQICSLAVQNVTSNEEIRERWNGNQINEPYKNIYENDSTFIQKAS
jgi:hypothetical protein